jgi:hypothetical protein
MPDTKMASWGNVSDIEFVYNALHGGTIKALWTERRCGIASISGQAVTMKPEGWAKIGLPAHPGQFDRKVAAIPSDIENAYELLNQPGEWYLDRTAGVVYYIPLPGQDIRQACVVAPVLESLVLIEGTAQAPVSHIGFAGLTFAYTTWMQPSTAQGLPENQANTYGYSGAADDPEKYFAVAAVRVRGAHYAHFERCAFTHLGGAGVDFAGGSQNCALDGCALTDISDNGIRIGQVTIPHPAANLEDRDIKIVNSYLDHVACEFHGGVAILAGYTKDLLLAHNEISHVPYSGISMGWGWGMTPSFAENNQIVYNNVHEYTERLGDGGAIYTLDAQGSPQSTPVSSIQFNYCHDAPLANKSVNCIYDDEGSAYLDVSHNVCQRIGEGCNWYSAWTKTIHNISVHDNYADTPKVDLKGTDCQFAANKIVVNGEWPAEAQKIMQQAGLEGAYKDLPRMQDASAIVH